MLSMFLYSLYQHEFDTSQFGKCYILFAINKMFYLFNKRPIKQVTCNKIKMHCKQLYFALLHYYRDKNCTDLHAVLMLHDRITPYKKKIYIMNS